ncbi:MAG: ATP-dependent zinc metalloprotease FtsH [Defluviitaleaceae bacterium]|nr:ATP-dependent zinc metalloprotease FtsH [Defluviitaleaceae bacterium]
MGTQRKNFGIYMIVIVFIMFIFIALNMNTNTSNTPPFDYSDLVAALEAGEVESLDIARHSEVGGAANVEVTLRPGVDVVMPSTPRRVQVPDMNSFMEIVHYHMATDDIAVDVTIPQSNFFLSLLTPFLILLIPLTIMLFFIHQMQGGGGGGGNRVMSFGKSRAKAVVDDKRKVTFRDVAGLEEEKTDLQEIVEFLKQPKKFVEIGARIPKGVLLVGPPGTGKTLLARAVAGEAGVPFYSISGSDFVEMFVGVGASRVRDLFDQAKKSAPCIVFIDEIDAVGRKRGAGLGGGHDEREQTLNQLLVEMDGFGVNEGIIILAATNRPDILDPALLRPGRFDRRVVVDRPDVKGREEILGVHARGKKLADDVELNVVAGITSGFTGADLENLLNESALLAAREGKKEITMLDVRQAFVKVAMGTEKKSRVVPEKEKRAVAYHEAGHGIIMEVLGELDPVHVLSIIPVGRAGGYAMQQPSEDKTTHSKKFMEQTITSLMGGRAAEYLIFNDITTGASNDIMRATSIARDMVTKYGMSEVLGPIMFGNENDEVFLGRDFAQSRNYGEEVAAQIDKEIERFVNTGYSQALEILQRYMETMHKTADLLMQKEKITGDEFRNLFDPPLPKKGEDWNIDESNVFGESPLVDLTDGMNS